MQIDERQILDYLEQQEEDMLRTLEDMVNRPSCGLEPEDAKIFGRYLKELLEQEGFVCHLRDVGNGHAETLAGVWGSKNPGKPILFSGHYDTALHRRFMQDNPFRVEDGKVHGVGVLDMKGGIVIALYVLRALKAFHYKAHPIKFLFSGDEEACHRGSNGGEVFLQESKGCLAAFNMETGLVSNALALGRKGVCRCSIETEGVEAHAGNDFTSGRSAIVDLSEKCLEMHNLTNLEAGTTVNVATIEGGTIYAAVPKHCETRVEMRFLSNKELENTQKRILEICEKEHIEGCQTTVTFTEGIKVFEKNPANVALLNDMNTVAGEYGFPAMGGVVLGGASDAAYSTIAGVPSLCSCGAMGEWNHTVKEYILKDSLLNRSKLYTMAVLNIDSFESLK